MRPPRFLSLFLALLALAGLSCTLATGAEPGAPTVESPVVVATNAGPPPTPLVVGNQPAAQLPLGQAGLGGDLEAQLITLYQQVNPAVVHILVYAAADDNTPLGSGTGFLYDGEGRVVTNNHVVADGRALEIVFADGQRRRGEVLGADIDSDLAVVQLDSAPTGVTPLTLGDSNAIVVGQLVIAIGNPFGEQSSMSLGIISGLSRSLRSQRLGYSLPEVIQTDAPINPGNSGGPLLNLRGEVVGVNSAIRSATGVNSGVGFAIPVNAIKRIVPALITDGAYTYPYLGVRIDDLNLNLQESFNLPQVNGAYVTGLLEDGPALASGLIAADQETGLGGDLIVAINGQPVNETADLISYLVFNAAVGQTVELTVLRDGQTTSVPLTLGARP
jgi:2-alkenal reductase